MFPSFPRRGGGEFGSPVEASVGVSVGVVAECWGDQDEGGGVAGGGAPREKDHVIP